MRQARPAFCEVDHQNRTFTIFVLLPNPARTPRIEKAKTTRVGRAVGSETGLKRKKKSGQTHFASGGRLMSTAFASCPVSSPHFVPRS
jgi:hypothetical protein